MINSFDVFKRMGEQNNRAFQLAPLGNILNMRAIKAGTKITIGVGGNVIGGLINGKYVGGLILCDKAEFERVKGEMERSDLGPCFFCLQITEYFCPDCSPHVYCCIKCRYEHSHYEMPLRLK